jgi:hypothetical protein
MRTTLTLEPDVAQALRELAYCTGRSLKAVVNETLRAGLSSGRAPVRAKRYRLEPAALGGVVPGVDLDKALRLADALEDEGIARKLEARKRSWSTPTS